MDCIGHKHSMTSSHTQTVLKMENDNKIDEDVCTPLNKW